MLERECKQTSRRRWAGSRRSCWRRRFADEMWQLFEQGELKPDSVVTGIHIKDETPADLEQVVFAIEDMRYQEMAHAGNAEAAERK